jgi:hypothetical protein
VTSLARPQSSRDPYFMLTHNVTAPFLRLFVPNSLTVHPRSLSSKAVLAASPVVSATPCTDYSPAVTSSAPFLGLFVSSNSMVQRRITFTLSSFTLAREPGASVLMAPPLCYSIFFVSEGVDPSTRPLNLLEMVETSRRTRK